MIAQIIMELNTEREIHMMGDIVAVCWNINGRTKKVQISSIEYTETTWERSGDPYIDFIQIRQDSHTDELYEDEDSPIDGGIGIEQAEILIAELKLAIDYMNELNNANQAKT